MFALSWQWGIQDLTFIMLTKSTKQNKTNSLIAKKIMLCVTTSFMVKKICDVFSLMKKICCVLCGVRGSSELRKYQISHSEIPSGDVECRKSHLEIRGFAKHIESRKVTSQTGNAILLVKLFCFFPTYFFVLLDICR